MKTTDNPFNDFVTNEILRIFRITKSDYDDLLFKAGIKAYENNEKYKSYFVSTGAFWDCFCHRVNFFNMTLIAEEKFIISVEGETPINMDLGLYFKTISQKFELPKRVVNLINKQYSIDFENSLIFKNGDFKLLKQQRRTRTPRKVKNQTEINLNTI